jgi:hypothetical protein
MLAKFYGWTFDAIDGMSFEQIDSAYACMPIEQTDGSVRPNRRSKGIPVESVEQAQEISANWRDYYGI